MELRNLGKKMGAYLLTFAMIMPIFPQISMEVHATELLTDTDLNHGNEIQPYAENNAGDFNVTGGTSGTHWTYDETANTLTFNQSGSYTVTGDGTETSEQIIVSANGDIEITIDNINIKLSDKSALVNNSDLTLLLDGDNYLKVVPETTGSGIENTKTLVIDSQKNGSLYAEGSANDGGAWQGAGIQGSNITIENGIITAKTNNGSAAGIGGVENGSIQNIQINGGIVTAYGGTEGPGIGGGKNGTGKNIKITGGTVVANAGTGRFSEWSGAGIGGGRGGNGEDITISGGNVVAVGASNGAGIGGGRGGSGKNIKITNGTVTARGYVGIGSGNEAQSPSENISIENGSIKGNIDITPINGQGKNIYLLKIDGQSGENSISVDEEPYTREGNHEDDGAFYLYLTGENHEIKTSKGNYRAIWNGSNAFALKPYLQAPTVKTEAKTKNSITVKPLENQNIYGTAQYKLQQGTTVVADWRESNVFEGLAINTEYTVYARYSGNTSHFESAEGTMTVITKKDGTEKIIVPIDLTAVYGQKLSDIDLSSFKGWSWVNEDTAVSVGSPSYYPARFDTTDLEDAYDFLDVVGYDEGGHYVQRNIGVVVDKAESTVTITTDSMDKTYDKESVSEPAYTTTGSTGAVTIAWKKNTGTVDVPNWEPIQNAPSNAGSYQVIVTVSEDNNYNSATATLNFAISLATNDWKTPLSINGWIYNGEPNTPTATAKFGDVVFTYNTEENGTYTDEVPTNAGTYYVKATVAGNENYTGLEATKEFSIAKANSTVTITTDSLDKTYDKNSVSEPAYTTTGSTGAVTIAWKKNTGTVDVPNWETITNAPSNAGSYQVIVTVSEDSNYNSAEATLGFIISQATNEWTDRLSMNGWTYNEEPNTPTATVKFGDIVFTYSKEENGTYTAEKPKDTGTYYVKATVVGNDNYTGLEETATFDVLKAIPTPEKITGLVLGQGQALEILQLPAGFAWKEETIVVDELGNYQFKAIYTPADTTNYETVEVMLDVEVVPMRTPLNHIPTIIAKDITLMVGDKFNDTIALKDVTATDTEDGDITKDIKIIKNAVDTSKAGTYEVSYQVTDSQGASITKTIKVVVKAKPVTSDKDNSTGTTDSAVKTGDQTNVSLYILLAGLSALIITLLTALKRRMRHARR